MTDSANTSNNPQPILVGIDGSDPSKAALEWAGNQAQLTGFPLLVIATWQYPTSAGWMEILPADIDFKGETQRMLDENVNAVLGTAHGIVVATRVIQGHPALTLVELSRSASLVVVGSRGHGEFVGMLIGSTSEFLTTHAHCPVVVVRNDDSAEE
jgi:nucleotide-binding universal stress UspA family protein